jgi:CheY-like chemotaxis protein
MSTDSSKRAVEAADNVVHACDLNMQMPEAPLTPTEPGGQSPSMPVMFSSRTRGSSGASSTSTSGNKRSSGHGADPNFQPGPPSKRKFKMTETEIVNTYYHMGSRRASISGPSTTVTEVYTTQDSSASQFQLETRIALENSTTTAVPSIASSTHRCVSTRKLMRNLVNIALRAAHPTSEVHTETDLGETIEVRNLGSRGEMQKRTIDLKIERNVPEMIITDVQSLEFPIQKVLDNAIKFTESGSIAITVQLGAQLQVVDIWVADTGRGITEESKQSLFTPHFQEDASISRARDGLGLSLFNAKAHVRMALGGDVTLERSATEGPFKGSEFLIRLPISSVEPGSTDPPLVGMPPQEGQQCCRPEPQPEQSLSSTPAPPAPTPAPSLPITPTRLRSPSSVPRKRVAFNRHLAVEYPLHILIAEDNSINREVAMGSLNKLGYTKDHITVAYDGLEAVQLYTASLAKLPERRFDAILMDIWMPNMDGFEATARILDLAKEEGMMPKIIAVTADITGGCVDQAKASGMHGFLAKPYKVLDIEHLILQHFGKV